MSNACGLRTRKTSISTFNKHLTVHLASWSILISACWGFWASHLTILTSLALLFWRSTLWASWRGWSWVRTAWPQVSQVWSLTCIDPRRLVDRKIFRKRSYRSSKRPRQPWWPLSVARLERPTNGYPVDKVLWLCLPSKTFHVSSRPNAELLLGKKHGTHCSTNHYHMMRGCKSETCSKSESATGLSHMSHPHRAPVLRLRDGWLFFRCWRSITRVPERKVRSGCSVLMDSHAITNSGPSGRVVVQKRKASRIAEPGKAGRRLKILEVGS